MNRSTKSTVSGNSMKVRRRLSLLMLLVFMMTLFAGIVVTSGCGSEEKKPSIKSFYESSRAQWEMKLYSSTIKTNPNISDFKWYLPDDNTLVYEFYLAPNYSISDESILDTSLKSECQSVIRSNIKNGFAEYSHIVRVYDSEGNFLTERTYTENN